MQVEDASLIVIAIYLYILYSENFCHPVHCVINNKVIFSKKEKNVLLLVFLYVPVIQR